MCKIIVIPNASKVENLDDFTTLCAELLSDQRDGFGMVAQGERGAFGIRALNGLEVAGNLPEYVHSSVERFGYPSPLMGSLLFHGRTSTNVVSIGNTHPITRDGHHLIHNGVVTDHGDKYAMATSNDSEHVLWRFLNGGIKGVADNLTGYYAAAIIDPNGMLHLFRDDIARLYWCHSEKLDSPIFATTEYILEAIGDYLGETFVIAAVKENSYLVFNRDGSVAHYAHFTPRGSDVHADNLASMSLGREATSSEIDYSDFDEIEKGYETWEDDDYLDGNYSAASRMIKLGRR